MEHGEWHFVSIVVGVGFLIGAYLIANTKTGIPPEIYPAIIGLLLILVPLYFKLHATHFRVHSINEKINNDRRK